MFTSDSRRDAAKQTKAQSQERRAALDARHKYLIGQLADAVALAEEEVEEALISDVQVKTK